MSDSVRPHRRQPTRLRHPWDSPGKNTGVGCRLWFLVHPLSQSLVLNSRRTTWKFVLESKCYRATVFQHGLSLRTNLTHSSLQCRSCSVRVTWRGCICSLILKKAPKCRVTLGCLGCLSTSSSPASNPKRLTYDAFFLCGYTYASQHHHQQNEWTSRRNT